VFVHCCPAQGNRVRNLLDALQQLPVYGLQPIRTSMLYETDPMGPVQDQPSFVNAAVLARTDLPPLQLLYHLKQMEKGAGRDLVGGLRWGPRPLDLDIIFYGTSTISHESLKIPHERCGGGVGGCTPG
jgi:2-amino-4-hydroxy-6-hydroxymethyldihydropteridine diphosphokinase/dihydropteroate synthase